jgi:hypothetical protein
MFLANNANTILSFSEYSSITQGTPTAGSGQVTVTWTNGGGLVSGDHHRIYYTADTPGTKSVQDVIDVGTYVESSAYTDTSKVVTGLTGSQQYAFVVVDLQVVNSTEYAGARSGVQLATPTGGASGPANLNTITNLAKASVKTINGTAIANIKSWLGLT